MSLVKYIYSSYAEPNYKNFAKNFIENVYSSFNFTKFFTELSKKIINNLNKCECFEKINLLKYPELIEKISMELELVALLETNILYEVIEFEIRSYISKKIKYTDILGSPYNPRYSKSDTRMIEHYLTQLNKFISSSNIDNIENIQKLNVVINKNLIPLEKLFESNEELIEILEHNKENLNKNYFVNTQMISECIRDNLNLSNVVDSFTKELIDKINQNYEPISNNA